MENILFIFTDQWQAKCTGFHGHKVVKTPNLDKLAKKSIDFTNSFTVCPLCTPSRGSIMTGLYPHQSGVIDNCDVGATRQEYLPHEAYTWIDAMKDSGRKTGYFGKWHLGLDWQENREGIDFDICRIESNRENHETRIPTAPVTERGQFKNYKLCAHKESNDMYAPFYGKLHSIEDRFEYKVTKKAIAFLEENKDEPWCLTASLVGPHFPNLCPEPFYSMYDDCEITLPENMNDTFMNKPWYQNRKWWPNVVTDSFDEKEWKKTIRAYYASISMMDYFIGQILDKAKECSGGRKTRVIFTADHGEMIGAHSKFDKGSYFYEEVLKTPLLLCENINGNQQNILCNRFCNTLDIAQTLFSLADKKCENGVNLFEVSDEAIDKIEQEVFSNYYKYNGHSFEIRTIRTERYKYSFIPQDIDELYDLENDPYELRNLSDDYEYQDIKEILKKKVIENMKQNNDYLLNIIEELPEAGCLTAPSYPKLRVEYERSNYERV